MGRRLGVLALVLGAISACRGPADPPYVDGVRFNPEFIGIGVGQTDTVVAVPLDRGERALSDRADRLTFHSLNSGIARVSALGDGRAEVTGVELGETVVEAALGRGTGRLRVSVQPAGLASIRIEPDPLRMGGSNGTFRTAEAILLDADGDVLDPEGFSFQWTIADVEVANFLSASTSPTVRIRALSNGTTTLSVRVGSQRETVIVEVTGL